ncbi:hypothetical protein HDU83_006057 [Entophlyctis luteolus]|nr:hypothetical protein HDU83_006057 [Entophlyctis luteolus]KAJ3380218.1 hypothetical protein HDU84_006073 [Entophlyctis sp. JEL0112]
MSIDNLATVDEVRKRLMKQNKKKGLAKTKVIPRAEEKGYSRKEMFCLDMMYTLQPHDPSLSMVDLDEFLDKEWMSISKHERAVFSEMYKNVKDIYSASMNRSVKCSKTEW